MLDINSVIDQMLVLFIMLMVGFIAGKTGVIDDVGTKKLSRLALSVCQGCLILGSVMNIEQNVGVMDILKVLGVASAFYILAIVIAQVVPVILHTPADERGLYKFMTMFGNVGFMGFPVVASIFGAEYVFYASIFNIPFNILSFSLGIYYISGGASKGSFNWKSIINPSLVATLLALVILLCRIPIPYVIESSVSSIGDMVVPCAMMIIGSSLAHMNALSALGQWRVYVFSLFRLLVMPVIAWAVFRLFVTDPVILGIATVIAAMPVASSATMFTVQYGGKEQLASWSVFVSTVMSVVTIPLIVYLLLI